MLNPLPHTGWPARLALAFERRGAKTLLARREHYGPLRVQRALYPEGEAVCHAIVLHPPAGIVGGDRLHIAAHLGAGAQALLTTPGAGKWYRSAGEQACQDLDFEVGAGAVLEWLPQENIVFDGARSRMDCSVRLAEDAGFIGWDLFCLGRRAAGERFVRGELRLSTRIERDGRALWQERGVLAGNSPLLQAQAGLAGRSVCATLLAALPTAATGVAAELLAACRGVAAAEAGTLCGISALPELLVARYLGDSAEAAREWLEALWQLLRPALTGRAAQRPRIWNT